MARVTKGGKIKSGDDKTVNYAVYTSKGSLIRRAAHPEYYLHSWSTKVKRNRELFAEAMVNYSKLDIVTKQAFKEAIRIVPILPPRPIVRRLLEKLREKVETIREEYGLDIPDYVLENSPHYQTLIKPTLKTDITRIIAPGPGANLYKHYRPGPGQWIYDYYAWYENKDEEPTLFPNELPLPQQTEIKQLKEHYPVTTIVIEIDPTGWTGQLYNAYIWAKSEYHEIKHFVSEHKKVIIILVVIGAIITLGWELIIGGIGKVIGSVTLVNEKIASAPLLGMLMNLGINYKIVKDYFYKKLLMDWAEDIDVYAFNESRGTPCYKSVVTVGNEIYFMFYEGPDKKNKGQLAAWVKITVDPEKQEGTLDCSCGDSKDRILVFWNGALLFRCNIGDEPYDIVTLWNNTMKMFGRARISWEGRVKTYAFEDRPDIWDEDYDDAFVKIHYNEQWQPIAIEVIDGTRGDELFIYWRGQLIAHFPKK